MRVDGGAGLERRATVELIPATRSIVQARGRFNQMPGAVDQRVIRAWAVGADLRLKCGW